MMRHAYGFKLANDGQDTRALQQYLGHKKHSARGSLHRTGERPGQWLLAGLERAFKTRCPDGKMEKDTPALWIGSSAPFPERRDLHYPAQYSAILGSISSEGALWSRSPNDH
jgi:hypothetical protein